MMSTPYSVLIVEDHHDSAMFMNRYLTSMGLITHVAEGYAEALQVAKWIRFDLLVSDILLPDGDGCDLLKELQKSSAIAGIALTACGKEERERCTEAGFVEFMTKPVSLDELGAVVRRVLKLTEAVRSLRPSLPDDGFRRVGYLSSDA